MKLLKRSVMKKIEGENPKASIKALLRAFILTTTIFGIIVIVAPSIQDNVLLFGVLFGLSTIFAVYSTTLNEIDLLNKLDRSQETGK